MAIWMLDLCLKHASKLKHEFRWGCRGVVIGQAKVPGPMFQPFQSDVPLDSSCEVPTRQQQQRTSGKRQRCFQPLQSQLDSLLPKRADAAVAADTTFLPELNHSAGVRPLNPRKLASLLWADKSEHAICIGDWDQLLQCCDVALSTTEMPLLKELLKQMCGTGRNVKSWVLTPSDRRFSLIPPL